MKTERILLPVDLRNCALDALRLTDGLAKRSGASLTLLHVVTLNILAPEGRIYDELSTEADTHLKRLCREYLPSVSAPVTRVRFGKVVEEILAEIQAEKADLVVVSTHGPSFRERFEALWRPPYHPVMSRGVERITREAGCGVFIAPASLRFDCDGNGNWPHAELKGPANGVPMRNELWDGVPTVISDRRHRLQYS